MALLQPCDPPEAVRLGPELSDLAGPVRDPHISLEVSATLSLTVGCGSAAGMGSGAHSPKPGAASGCGGVGSGRPPSPFAQGAAATKLPQLDQAGKQRQQQQGPKQPPKLQVTCNSAAAGLGGLLCPQGMAKALMEFSTSSPRKSPVMNLGGPHSPRRQLPACPSPNGSAAYQLHSPLADGHAHSPRNGSSGLSVPSQSPRRPAPRPVSPFDNGPGRRELPPFINEPAAPTARRQLPASSPRPLRPSPLGPEDGMPVDGLECYGSSMLLCDESGSEPAVEGLHEAADLQRGLLDTQPDAEAGSQAGNAQPVLMPHDDLEGITMEKRNRIERHLATCGQLKPQTSGGLTLIPTPTNSYGSPQPSLPGSDGGYAHAGTAAAAMRFAAAGAVMSGGGSMIGGTGDFADACSALREVGGAGGNYGALLPQHMGADGMGAMPLPDDQAAAFLHASLPMDALVGGMAPGEEHPSPVDVLTLAAGVLEHHRGDWAAAADTMIRMIAHDLNRARSESGDGVALATKTIALQELAGRMMQIRHAGGLGSQQPCYSDPGPSAAGMAGNGGSGGGSPHMMPHKAQQRTRVRAPRPKSELGTRRPSRMGPSCSMRISMGDGCDFFAPDGGSASARAPPCGDASGSPILHALAPPPPHPMAVAMSPNDGADEVDDVLQVPLGLPPIHVTHPGPPSSQLVVRGKRKLLSALQPLAGEQLPPSPASAHMASPPPPPPAAWDAPVITFEEAAIQRGMTATPDSLAGCSHVGDDDEDDPISMTLGQLSQPCSPHALMYSQQQGLHSPARSMLAPGGGSGCYAQSAAHGAAGAGAFGGLPQPLPHHGSGDASGAYSPVPQQHMHDGASSSPVWHSEPRMGPAVHEYQAMAAAARASHGLNLLGGCASPLDANRQLSAELLESAVSQLPADAAASFSAAGSACSSPVKRQKVLPYAAQQSLMHQLQQHQGAVEMGLVPGAGSGGGSKVAMPIRRHGSSHGHMPTLAQQVMQRQLMRQMSGGRQPAQSPQASPIAVSPMHCAAQQEHTQYDMLE